MAKRGKFIKPQNRRISSARVVASKKISPNFVRVTIAGDELGSVIPMGFDQWFRMFVPQPGQKTLRLPSSGGGLWYTHYRLMAKDVRPVVRNYTIRDFRAAGSGTFGGTTEIDIDFAAHGDLGPASAWASTTEAGDELAILDEGRVYNPTPGAEWQLLVGDESALPAIAGIMTSAPRDLRAEVFIEIADAEDAQDLPVGDGVNVHWLVRGDSTAHPGALALRSVMEAELPTGPSYAFVAGESGLATSLRRHLVIDRGVPKSDIAFTGYWRHGHASF
ncbi:NADPH-dependent ferric siderophore reductase [Rhodococcus sp. WMMA185]|uniref:siderophore-interacting protein n=1 Tax=Rhodococcus sp. WMMA185 TaxID=679318 RepID=UPI00087868AA|nr:siderophore-interacting protein [Rhodococcus sp. WMMA185]AOW93175.1 NADPH-dependent ferric siderophore reductase [Rhodococcus sp. WMMA185]